ncbi:MAG: patatin-like phospholipase family protein [Deltaproteobacteria bacterium]|nr:patatin-like phospholipase family protein [Deltaproteobacteria bacterium]
MIHSGDGFPRGGPEAPVGRRKSILYWAPERESLRDLRARLLALPQCEATPEGLVYQQTELRWRLETKAIDLLDRLHSEYFNLVILDLRSRSSHGFEAQVEEAMTLLDAMDSTADIEARFGFHRVVALVSGDEDRTDRLIATLGARHVGRVLRGPAPGERLGETSDAFARLLLDEMLRLMLERRPGLRALCCSGGGITGIYFELGALKCLSDCLRPAGVLNELDLYFGISAGATVTGLLANGYTVDDCLASLAGVSEGELPPTNLSVLRLQMIDAANLADRVGRALLAFGQTLWRARHGRLRVSLESLLLDYSDLFGPPLRAAPLEQKLRELFTAPGRSNDFRSVRRRLYIGATDQDLRRHVLFGSPGHDDVPISVAVQASSSLHPAFSSTQIKDRFFCDGAVTATSHVPEAIRMGADLLFVIDPFLPYVSKEPGYARTRGMLYNIDQDVRTLSYTRFERLREAALRRHPAVSSYTFLPANSLRRTLSVNPMDHRPYLSIWRGAYLSTLRRIQHLRYRMEGDLALHGMGLDTSRAEEIAERLRGKEKTTLDDFFPGGRRRASAGRRLKRPALSSSEPAPEPQP